MSDLLENKMLNSLLLITIVGEFVLPWILKHFYNGYDSRKMVMSVLGSPESPVSSIYNVWLMWLGILLIITSVAFFVDIKKTSMFLAILTLLSIIIFAIGAGILAGIFRVNASKDVVTIASKIHGAGAAIGFMTLLFFPLLNSIAAFQQHDKLQGGVCIFAFVLAVLFFVFFIIGDKERFQNTIFAYAGVWERVTLFFMYIPFIYKATKNLIFE